MFDEVILIVLGYSQRSISLFLVSKTFERLCDLIFPSEDDMIKSIKNNQIECVRKLINCIHVFSVPLLSLALKFQRFEIIDMLYVHPKIDLMSCDNDFFLECCKTNQISLVKRLIKDVNPTIPKNQPMIEACNRGYVEIVKLLLKDPRIYLLVNDKIFFENIEDPSRHIDIFLAGNNIFQLTRTYEKTIVVERLLNDPRVDSSIDHNRVIQNDD